MPRSRLSYILAAIYLLLIAVGLLMPKSDDLGVASNNFFAGAFHLVLYAPMGLDIVSNLLLFIPGMLILIYLLPKVEPLAVFALCSLASVITELFQLMIPGRVSSLLDVILNVSGMLAALFVLFAFPNALQRLRKI